MEGNKRGVTVAFLGPDGSGKSTVIEGLKQQNTSFDSYHYFHLKPFPKKNDEQQVPVTDPHQSEPYGLIKSYVKLLFFIIQYNWGWFKYILPLKRKRSLIIFDRYYDDILVDYKRYRYGGRIAIAKFIRRFIPKPDLYCILTADAKIINSRKQEVPIKELQRQINAYRNLVDSKRYIGVDVDCKPQDIVSEINAVIKERINEGD